MASHALNPVCSADRAGQPIDKSSLQNVHQPQDWYRTIGAHEEPGRPAVFRFLDLPIELRLIVYAELFSNSNKHDGKECRYAHILSTSKAIHAEAEKELYLRSTMPIRITATALKTHDFCTHTALSIGNIRILNAINSFYTDIVPAWSLSQMLPTALSKVHKISLAINFEADEENNNLLGRPFSAQQFNQVHHILAAVVAASRANLKTLDVTFNISSGTIPDLPGLMDDIVINGIVWPLDRLTPAVTLSLRGFPDQVERSMLSRHAKSTVIEHPFTLYRDVRAKVQKVLDVLKDTSVVGKRLAGMLRSVEKTIESKRWRRGDEDLVNDLRFLGAWILEPKVLALMSEMQTGMEMNAA
ncbi:hypothetical protein TI39_contig338g00012 [Zymoseptoria brevis]|uniref:Uncharacterized protein n=1 Tax=Zymoseptoria brevis TaxID=1047168 RepID=A0A0F4GT67_9PEZI|nr:hypothetical protein TI39_contig338g00012 [Zymoseptoria brevis]